jgi:eukaryotic-like serine/threonine-protein kinase
LHGGNLPAMAEDLIAGRYELERKVGSGGMSRVYRAHDRLLERTVALKMLHEHYSQDDEYVERFRREARAVAQLAHPNVVTVIDRGEHEGRQYIVFEYVDGENLKELVGREGALPPRQVIELGLQIASALASAHARGVVHRDVKPQNVILTDEGRPKVTDFGIARSSDVESVTLTGTVMGTSEYIAPEQARGESVDVRSDVYSLGVILYELATGEVPYPGENPVSVAMRHLHEPVPSARAVNREIPARLDSTIRRAMAKDPEERFGSMDELIAELETAMRGLGDGEQTIVLPAPARQRRGRRRARRLVRVLALSLVALLLVAAAAVGAFALAGWFESSDDGNDGSVAGAPISAPALRAHDPFGDDMEHDDEADLATDSDRSTFWRTEQYVDGLGKEGVGILLDAASRVAPARFLVMTDTPGFKAEIRAGMDGNGPFRPISSNQTVRRETTFSVDTEGARYFVVWITELQPGFEIAAHINEVRVRGG